MAALVKALLQPVAIVWLGLLGLCAWQIYRCHYRWAVVPGALFLFVFITGSSPKVQQKTDLPAQEDKVSINKRAINDDG